MKGKTKIKWGLLIIPMLVALVAAAIIAPPQVAFAAGAALSVVVETYEDSGYTTVRSTFSTEQTIYVRATISNTGDAGVNGVTASITWTPGTALSWVAGDGGTSPHTQNLPNLAASPGPGNTATVDWTLRCEEAGSATITVAATGTDAVSSDQITAHGTKNILQVAKAHLRVLWFQTYVDSPSFQQNTFSTEQTFTIRVCIDNTGEAAAGNVTAALTMTAGPGTATINSGPTPATVATLAGGGNTYFTWEVQCTSAGDVTFLATPSGDDENTGVAIPVDNITTKDVTIHQEAKAHLSVTNITTDAHNVTTVSTEQTFHITATVKNNNGAGGAVAENVSATLSITGGAGNATINSGPSPASVATLAGDATQDFTWNVTCDEVGDVIFTVTPTGDDENTGDPVISPDNIDTDTITIDQELKAHLEVTWVEAQQLTVSTEQVFWVQAAVRNTGEAVAEGVSADLSFSGVGSATIDSGPDIISGDNELINNETVIFEWDVECTGAGDMPPGVGNVTITVTPTGNDENTDVDVLPANIDTGDIEITQELKAHLTVTDVTTDAHHVTIVSTEQTFHIIATVKNTGIAVAEGVSADLSILPGSLGSASINSGAVIILGDNKLINNETVTFKWNVTCTGAGPMLPGVSVITFEVTPTGDDENTGVAVLPANIDKDTIDITQELKAHLEVTNVTTDTPNNGFISECQIFHITATVRNAGVAVAETVSADLTITGGTGGATINSGPSPASVLTLAYDATQDFTWNVTCTGTGTVDFLVTPTGDDENTLADVLENNIDTLPFIITQQTPPDLTVSILSPVDGEGIFLGVGQEFAVTAIVTNSGEATATDVELTLDPGLTASVVSPGSTQTATEPGQPAGYITGGGTSDLLTWTLRCDAPDWELGGNLITVTPAGKDLNTDESITYFGCGGLHEDSVNVYQYPKVHLVVEITAPQDNSTTYSTEQDFTVSATVTNTGEPDAWQVTATISWSPADSVYLTSGTLTQDVGTLQGHGAHDAGLPGASAEVSWALRCNEASDATITVTAAGEDEYGYYFDPQIWLLTHDPECSLVSSPGRPIPGNNIEPDSVTVHQEEKAHLLVEILTPVNGETFSTSQYFDVVAKVYNTGEAVALGVTAAISIDDNATASAPLTKPTVPTTIPGGGYAEVAWTVQCTGSGDVTISVTASGADENTEALIPPENIEHDQIIVHQETAVDLAVTGVVSSQDTVSVSQDFSITATVTNSGEADAIGVTATVNIGGDASVVLPPPATQTIGTIPGGRSTMVGWTLHCDGAGSVNITVTATGTDENSGDEVIATSEPVTVNQEAAAALEAEITTPEADTIFSTSQDFTVTATVTNNGEADAIDVTATISIDANASLAGGTPTQATDPPTIASLGTGTVNWTLHCNAPGPSTITVTPAGIDANTGEPIPGANIEPDSVTVNQEESGGLDLGITKEADKLYAEVEETVNFTITITNYGPTNASGVEVTDSLPDGLTYVSYEASQGTYDDASGVWDVGNVVEGASATLVLTCTVTGEGTITNTATITAVDQPDPFSANDSASVNLNVTSWDISLDEDWNLISLPLIPDTPATGDLLAGISGNVTIVWHYDAATLTWSSYIPGGPDPSLATMNDGKGYWIDMSAPDTLTVEGVELPPPPQIPPAYAVVEGWNLIGFKSTTARTVSDYLAAIDGKWTMIYGYANGSYFVAQSGDQMQPGLGYWIAVTATGTIYP